MKVEIEFDPFPAVRSNRNTWSKSVKAYHAKMNALRSILMPNIEEIVQSMIEDSYSITFVLPMAKSWSCKKRSENLGKFHKQKPDCDNLLKAFKDVVFYQHPTHNDCEVSTSIANKIWGEKGMIIIETEHNLY